MFKLFGDKIIWWIVILLSLISLLLVYSSGGNSSIVSHVPHLIMGLGLVFIFSRFNYKYFTNLSTILLVVSVFMLFFLIVFPSSREGVIASRWINLGVISFQPSELAKYSLILFLCRNLALYQDTIQSFWNFFFYIIIPSLIICLLILPSNLSTVILIIFVLLVLVFKSGFPIYSYFKYLLFPLILASMIFFMVLCLPPIKSIENNFPRITTWKNRICAKEISIIPLSWIDCSSYDSSEFINNNYQINKALGAINRGGVIGKGAGKSYYKKLLPDSKSDFIFAILVEEYGIVGGCFVLLLYLLFYQRILTLSVGAMDYFPRLLLFGLGTMIVFQALLHMSVSVNLLPVTGQTLPLISKGGSSFWVTSLGVGIILNISHQLTKFNS